MAPSVPEIRHFCDGRFTRVIYHVDRAADEKIVFELHHQDARVSRYSELSAGFDLHSIESLVIPAKGLVINQSIN